MNYPVGITALVVALGLCLGGCSHDGGPPPPSPDNLDSIDPQVADLIRKQRSRVDADRGDADARYILGQTFEANDFHDLAIDTYDQVLETKPSWGAVWFRKAVCLERQGDLNQAIESMRRAVEIEPTFAAAHWRLSMWLLDVGRVDDAEQLAERAIQLAPNDPAAWFAKTRILLARRDNRAAIQLINDHRLTRSSNAAYANFLLGTAYRQMGDLRRAAPFLAEEDFNPTWRDEWTRQLSQYHTGISRMRANASGLVRLGRTAEAIPLLTVICARDPKDQRSLNMLAACYLQSQQWEPSLRTLEESLAVDSEHFITNLNYAAALLTVHSRRPVDLRKALRYAEKAIALRPASSKSHAVRAMACQLLGENEEAVKSFARAYELDSRSPERAIQAARLEFELGQVAAAEERLQSAAERTEGQSTVLIELAKVKSRQGKVREAYELYERALTAASCSSSERIFVERKLKQLRRSITESPAL